MTVSRSDALVLFGVTGDLAHKMIFPALYAMAKRGALKVPVIGVASPKWSLAHLRNRVEDSIKRSGGIGNQRALHHLLSLLSYVNGDEPCIVREMRTHEEASVLVRATDHIEELRPHALGSRLI
jgi:glucose-6-phosphate 1-dehydrogenase